MHSATHTEKLITDIDVREYFRDSVSAAIQNQSVSAAEDTVYYIVNLLACFVRADRLFDHTPEGVQIQPLALIYAEAVEAASAEERHRALRRLGDVALLLTGVFSASLNRKVVDVDYYMAMGVNAYRFLSSSTRGTRIGRAFADVFEELAQKFPVFVDVLSEVAESARLSTDTDVMRLYEVWMRTGSPRAASRLRKLGIEPVRCSAERRYN